MGNIIVKSKAKVNLSLDILGTRNDGYHEVLMIVQTIPLYDMITISTEKSDTPSIELTCNKKTLPTDSRNLAYKAAEMLMNKAGITDKVKININTRIPVGGGLGGGSSKAASVLTGLNTLYKLGFSTEQLAEMSKPLGSDVPALVYGGCVLAKGTGTEVSPLPPLNKGYMLVVNPGVFVSTEKVYGKYDTMHIPKEAHPDTDLLIKLLKQGDLHAFARNMKNVLEYPVLDSKSKIKKLKQEMMQTGALGTMMTGSGSSIFSLFDDIKEAYAALEHFRKQHYFAVLINL
jgi:4-diphosphocytidyl-2-C-methyl-D-erythritol kinase